MKRLSGLFCVALATSLLLSPFGCGSGTAVAEDSAEDTEWDSEIGFDSLAEIEENFAFHFVSTQNERRSDEFNYSWTLVDGAVQRVGNIDAYSDTVNIAIMTYTGNVYSDFELSVDVRCGTSTSYWPVIGIRQQIPGKYYTTEGGGTGVFMQQNGKITLWGPISGGIVEKDIPDIDSYYPSVWHNIRILAVGTVLTVFVDGKEVLSSSVLSTDYVKGYKNFLRILFRGFNFCRGDFCKQYRFPKRNRRGFIGIEESGKFTDCFGRQNGIKRRNRRSKGIEEIRLYGGILCRR